MEKLLSNFLWNFSREDVDIKNPPETNAAYAFVLFQVMFFLVREVLQLFSAEQKVCLVQD